MAGKLEIATENPQASATEAHAAHNEVWAPVSDSLNRMAQVTPADTAAQDAINDSFGHVEFHDSGEGEHGKLGPAASVSRTLRELANALSIEDHLERPANGEQTASEPASRVSRMLEDASKAAEGSHNERLPDWHRHAEESKLRNDFRKTEDQQGQLGPAASVSRVLRNAGAAIENTTTWQSLAERLKNLGFKEVPAADMKVK